MTSLDELLDRTLPLNRKERYYTGTVLPALLCADSMAHLHRLGSMLGLERLDVRTDPTDCTVLFFTEYSLAESAFGPARERFAGLPTARDTPDVVILATSPVPVLIALEAKLYDRPSRPDLANQLRRQDELLRPLCERLAASLNVEQVTLAHAALLPAKLAEAVGELAVPVITWEAVRDAYADVDQQYFHAVLATALDRYDDLVSRWSGNQQGELAGASLVTRALAGDQSWSFMGRNGGLTGPALARDIITGGWLTQAYQCRHEPLPGNPNWFTVTDFLLALGAAGHDLDALALTDGAATSRPLDDPAAG